MMAMYAGVHIALPEMSVMLVCPWPCINAAGIVHFHQEMEIGLQPENHVVFLLRLVGLMFRGTLRILLRISIYGLFQYVIIIIVSAEQTYLKSCLACQIWPDQNSHERYVKCGGSSVEYVLPVRTCCLAC